MTGPTPEQKRARKYIAIFLIALIPLIYHPILFFSDRVEIEVEMIDAPRYCSDARRSAGLFHPRGRSGRVKYGDIDYCGSILTDRGHMTIPKSEDIFNVAQRRTTIIDKLSVGCRYEVLVTGYFPLLEVGAMRQTRANKKIHWVLREVGCG